MFKIPINCNSSFGFSALWAKSQSDEVFKFRPLLRQASFDGGLRAKKHGSDCRSFSSEGHYADIALWNQDFSFE